MNNATTFTYDASAANRSAYAGQLLLTKNHTASTDSWETGLNNNVLVLGCSGGGKTRNHLKPNLMQCQGSYVVLDTKGSLYYEMGPYLRSRGYKVDLLDFTRDGEGSVGYDPLSYIRWSWGHPCTQDIITVASAICSTDEMDSDPFWARAAANYLASYIAYVLEALPEKERNMASVVRVFEQAGRGQESELFEDLEHDCPESYAVSLFYRAKATARAERMHSSIMGIIAANILPFSHEGAMRSYQHAEQVDFRSFGREKRALFVKMDDLDHSLSAMTSLFIQQAFSALCDMADESCEGRLSVPVRFMLDDFSNLRLPDFDDVLSVIRSREISCTVICQTVSQLEARYGEAAANSIIGNCDRQIVLAFQDERTARYFSTRAGKTPTTLLETPRGSWWLFCRGERGVLDAAYRLENHPCYQDLLDAIAQSEAERIKISEEELGEFFSREDAILFGDGDVPDEWAWELPDEGAL